MRKARPNTRTTFRFVAPDDESIGDSDPKAYHNYLETMDESFLKLSGTPTFYWLRPMPLDIFRRAQDCLSADGDDESRAERLQSDEMFLIIRDAIDRCLVGADGHPIVLSIRADGSFETDVLRWSTAERRPDDALALILDDRNLAFNMFIALLRAANLTESEKKQ